MTDIKAWVESFESPNGGYTRQALEAMGVGWPPGRGWKRRLTRGKPLPARPSAPDSPTSPAARRAWYRDVYLQSPHWKGLKAKKRREEPAVCGHCRTDQGVDLHHLHYPKDVYQTKTKHVMWLCRTCHNLAHQFSRDQQARIRAVKTMAAKRLLTLCLLRDASPAMVA